MSAAPLVSVSTTRTISVEPSGAPPTVAGPAPFAFDVCRVTSAPPAAVPIDDSPFSFAFSGRHDDGPLPASLGGYYAHVASALVEAKQRLDAEMQRLSALEQAQELPRTAPPNKKDGKRIKTVDR